MFNLYNHIEELGKAHGYPNIQQLCRAADVPRSIMTELNKGRAKSISRKTAQKFADLLGVTIDVVYGIEKEKPAIEDDELIEELQILKDRPETRSVLKVMKNMTPEQVKKMRDWISTMQEG